MRDQEGLFEVQPAEPERSAARAPGVDKRFRAFDPHRVLLPPSLDDWLPEGTWRGSSPSWSTRCSTSSPILADYTDKRGFPPYDPRLMVRAADLRLHHRGAVLPGDPASLR